MYKENELDLPTSFWAKVSAAMMLSSLWLFIAPVEAVRNTAHEHLGISGVIYFVFILILFVFSQVLSVYYVLKFNYPLCPSCKKFLMPLDRIKETKCCQSCQAVVIK
jgi:hypothetical protein